MPRTVRVPLAFVLVCACLGGRLDAHAPGVAPVQAARAPGDVRIDGRLDDVAWQAVEPVTDFRQRDPAEGEPATERTELRVLYDADALYVGVRLFDREPQRIVRQQSRRDVAAAADTFTLFLDPHHDHLTGVRLTVSAAGAQRDTFIYNDTLEDESWDAVWHSAVSIEKDGWSVELRVPFSQLRFTSSSQPTWGINAERVIHRRVEGSWLALVPRTESALASRMAHLEGLHDISPKRSMEIRPYATARSEDIQPEAQGSPFNDGVRLAGGAGVDAKYGVSSNLTLDATINPDFGQVEVDPAVVNLTAFETFFEEKRPFFIEGSQTFNNFGRSGASQTWNFFRPDPTIFYSRRIGRAPQGLASAPYVDRPAATTILSAAKLTGRTRRGWTVSLVDAVTASEYASLSDGGLQSSRLQVEPLTNYAAWRAFKELGPRGGVGLIGTATTRSFGSEALAAELPSSALVGGADGHVFLDARRDWVVHGSLAASRVAGSQAAMVRLQRASPRYFQRPDAPHVAVDPLATSLTGWMGDVALNRNNGNVTVNARLWGTSPGFDTNDLGFVTQTDRGGAHGMVLFRKLSPDRLTRSRQLWVSKWWTWNFAGEMQGDGVQATANLQWLNYWRLNASGNASVATLDDKLTRGGPTVIRPGIRSLNLSIVSDTRRRVWLNAFSTWQARDFGQWSRTFGGAIEFRPSTALTLSVGPNAFETRNVAQYLTTERDPLATNTFGSRYVFGDLKQTEVAIVTRLAMVFTPDISLQVYAQPLVSSGAYSRVRELDRPRTYDFLTYGVDTGTVLRDPATGRLVIDPDAEGPASAFTLADPDFNRKSLRMNAILRWEWRPGSTMYLVWTEQRRDDANPGDFQFWRDMADLWSADADDVVMLKVSWWIGR